MHGTQPRTQMRSIGCKYHNLLLLVCTASSPVQLPEEIVPSDSCRVHTATIQKLKMALKEQQKNHETELKKQSMKHMVAMKKCERRITKNQLSKNRFSGVQVTLHSPACNISSMLAIPMLDLVHRRCLYAYPMHPCPVGVCGRNSHLVQVRTRSAS